MTITEEGSGLDIEPGVSAAEEAGEVQSVLDRVRARRNEGDDVLTIDIPSWDGGLRAKYRVLDKDDIDKMVRRIRARQSGQGKQSGLDADLDFLIKACIGIEAYDVENDETETLTNGYTKSLIHLLGKDDEMNHERQLVAYLFKGNTIAIAAHGMKVARWMQDTSKPVEDPQ